MSNSKIRDLPHRAVNESLAGGVDNEWDLRDPEPFVSNASWYRKSEGEKVKRREGDKDKVGS